VKPENKVYKEGEVYNNSKCCYNINNNNNNKKKKKGEIWGQNGIKKRWDYKYPSLLSSMAADNKEGGEFHIFPSSKLGENI
jgi:hypothetical protein